jgi:hypothetical protein
MAKTTTTTITPIGNTPYVILPCGTIARKLKPVLINGKTAWSLGLGASGKSKRISLDKPTAIQDYLEACEKAELTKQAKATQG